MALKDCIAKFGKALDKRDIDAITALVDSGLSEGEAVSNHLASMELLQEPGKPDGFRGSIKILPDQKRLIQLGKSSDPSTFLHETAHLFLELEKQFAAEFGVTEDQQAILDWLGVDSFDDVKRDHHEKFAETFEVYLEEGKAPSLALRDAFSAFRRWLTAVYRSFTSRERAELSPEIREVFDRLLATEAEIEQLTANPAFDQFFRSKEQAGMTDAEWEAYQKQAKRAKNKAQSTLDEQIIAELKNRKTQEWKEEKAPLIEEEKDRLSKLREYAILNDTIEVPMNHAIVAEANGGKIPGNMIGKTRKDGIDPEEYVAVYGYDSVDQMIAAIKATPALNKVANEAAENRMVEKYGDILNDGTIEIEARNAIHSEEQAKLLLIELKALGRKVKARREIDREHLKSESKRMIKDMTYAQIKPSKYYRAELRASQKAATATNEKEAYEAKVQQIANHYLYVESVLTRKRMETQRRYVKKAQTKTYSKREVHPEYAVNRTMLAKSYSMTKTDKNRDVKIDQVITWIATQVQVPNGYADLTVVDPIVAQMVVDKINGVLIDHSAMPTFEDLTAEQLRALYEQLRHMRFIGGKLADESMAEIKISRVALAESTSENATKDYKVTLEEKSGVERTLDGFKEFIFAHRRLGGIADTLDGFVEGGPASVEYRMVTEASNVELELTDIAAKDMDAAFKPVLKLINKRKRSAVTKADGKRFSLSHRQRFVLGLNWGNQGNREAVLQGMNENLDEVFTEADVELMLSGMTQVELEALNEVWAAKEKLWAPMSKVKMRMDGVVPPKIEAKPFTINNVQLTGGHYQLHYRRHPDDTARKDISVEEGKRDSIKMQSAKTLNERVGSGGRLVDLELAFLFNDLAENIHYIAFAEVASHLNVMFKGVDNPVVSAIQRGYSEQYYDNVIDTMDAIIMPSEATNPTWRFLAWVRGNMTYAFLVGSVRNVIQQPIAVTNAISQIGIKYVMQGAMEFYASPVKNWKKIHDASAFMKNRTKLVNREAREQMLKIDSLHPKIGAMKNMAFLPQTFMDSLVAFPTWMGAKTKYKAEHPGASEADAINYAGEMVAKTIGSGLSKDLGSILTQGEGMKQITFMGTFFNLTWNLHVENAQLLKRGKISGMEYARRLGWMAIAPALLAMWILDDIPEEDDEVIPHILKEIAFYNMSSLFLLKDLASTMDGFSTSIPGLKFADGIAKLADATKDLVTGDEELDADMVVQILKGLQPITKVPATGQITRTMQGIQDPYQSAYGSLVEGKERNR